MSDIAVYMIVNLKIHDAEEYKIYEKGFFPFLKKYTPRGNPISAPYWKSIKRS